MKLTEAQRRVLQLALSDGGKLEVGGQDGRQVRGDLIERLYSAGYLRMEGRQSFFSRLWSLTESGRAALREGEGE